MDYKTLILKKFEHIAHVQLNRPETMNAFDLVMVDELHSCFNQLSKDKDIRVIILSGANQAFCSGGDVTFLQVINSKSQTEIQSFLLELFQKISIVAKIEKPVIGALHGFVMGVGFSLALLCDIRLAAMTTKFRPEFPQMGIIPEVGLTHILPSLVGLGKAMEMIITGRRFDSVEAERLGIVNKITPDEKILDEAMALAKKIAGLPPLAVGMSKTALRRGAAGTLDESIESEASLNAFCYRTQDHKEATTAFFEKRKPIIRGC